MMPARPPSVPWLSVETLPTRRLLFQLAIAAGDDQTAAQHLEWARDKPREFEMIGARAQTLGWFGRVREARQVYEDAARLAERRDFPDVGTNHLAWATAMELVYGNADRAIELAHRVLARKPGYDSQLRAALTLAVSGMPSLAEQIADDLAAANPEHTLINSVLAPNRQGGHCHRARAALTCASNTWRWWPRTSWGSSPPLPRFTSEARRI